MLWRDGFPPVHQLSSFWTFETELYAENEMQQMCRSRLWKTHGIWGLTSCLPPPSTMKMQKIVKKKICGFGSEGTTNTASNFNTLLTTSSRISIGTMSYNMTGITSLLPVMMAWATNCVYFLWKSAIFLDVLLWIYFSGIVRFSASLSSVFCHSSDRSFFVFGYPTEMPSLNCKQIRNDYVSSRCCKNEKKSHFTGEYEL